MRHFEVEGAGRLSVRVRVCGRTPRAHAFLGCLPFVFVVVLQEVRIDLQENIFTRKKKKQTPSSTFLVVWSSIFGYLLAQTKQ